MIEEEAKQAHEKLTTKLFHDYKYMYDYNIQLVNDTAGWRKEKEGLIQDLTNANNENRQLKERIKSAEKAIKQMMLGALGLGIVTIGVICLL